MGGAGRGRREGWKEEGDRDLIGTQKEGGGEPRGTRAVEAGQEVLRGPRHAQRRCCENTSEGIQHLSCKLRDNHE